MKRITVATIDDLVSDFLEICGRESLSPNYVMTLLMFMWITNESSCKEKSLDVGTFSSLKLAYGDIQ